MKLTYFKESTWLFSYQKMFKEVQILVLFQQNYECLFDASSVLGTGSTDIHMTSTFIEL